MALSKVDPNFLNVSQVGGRRNLIINGAMQVAQRATSNGPNASNGVLSLDRWYVNSSGGTKTISQETFASGQTDVPDFPKNYMRLDVTTGDNNLGVHQRVEDVTVLGGKTVTLSFWAKGTNPAGGSFVSSWIQDFGSGGSSTVETEAKSGIVLTSTWQKFTFTFDVPSISGKTIGTSSYTWVELLRQPAADAGTAGWTADIAQVQLEVGDTATPFEHRSYGEELHACQRYYIQGGGGAYADLLGGQGFNITTTLCSMKTYLPAVMRSQPTFSYTGTPRVQNGQSGFALSNLTGGFPSGNEGKVNMFNMTGTSSGLTLYQPMNLDANAGGGFVKLDAEL